MLHFEDFPAGKRFDFKPVEVKADDVIAFAREFDPQPMHLSQEAGKESILGGLAASGWHTSALMMRALCDSYIHETASEGSPGVDSMEWKKAVLAGDTLSGSCTVIEARVSRSRPEIGIVKLRAVVTNQRGETVAICDYANMIRCHKAGDTA
ncbi:MaoC family dehydratase [Rhizobium sp. Root483D2]|uniref:MaoC family dehydratase n=1 Tax=Rhizobium sp. Root483D2 TaxID=1736545 RepID=UPI000712FF55|nr:MaoC family dehydratase [Rhizobium sp. Root483D2]KQY34724.1 enoyl-CoA hydratase [Rhizobium sp. Root483D2]